MSSKCLRLSRDGVASTSTNHSSDSNAQSHETEGFLKSMWHNLTSHPAHQTKADGSEAKDTKPDDKTKDSK